MSIDFGTFPRDILSERIAEKLLTLIREKKLRPGDRLPPERDLALQMGVSRPSLREALRALSIMKIIENRQGSGTYVTSLEPGTLIEHLDFIIALNDKSFLDLFQARKILEVGIASLAAQFITPAQLDALDAIHDRSTASLNDAEVFLKADLELHQVIADAARNQLLALFMKSINDLNIASRRRTGESAEVRRMTQKDHHAIIAALKSHDPQAAAQAMRAHLDHVESKLKQMVEGK